MAMMNEMEYRTIGKALAGGYRAAVYCRLSKDDDLQGESASIANQRDMLEKYCEKQGWEVVAVYQDDGFTGLNMERPDLQRMLRAIERRQINLVITKDLSRLGRNYLQTGHLIEDFFPRNGVRYIAMNDGIDTLRDNNDIAPFKNILNEMYSKDISIKVKTAFDSKCAAGEYVFGQVPLGYEKSREVKNTIIVNEREAEIVRSVFSMAVDGMSSVQIARRLFEEKVPTATQLRCPDRSTLNKNHTWSSTMVRHILGNRFYLGEMAYGKSVRKSVGSKEGKAVPKSEWKVLKDHHEPLVTPEIFARVALETPGHSTKRKREKHPLTGKIFCGGCGYSLSYKPQSGNTTRHFWCRKYSLLQIPDCCTYFNAAVLEETVLTLLDRELMRRGDQIRQRMGFGAVPEGESGELAGRGREYRKEYHDMQRERDSLYESYAFGQMDAREYRSRADRLTARMEELSGRIQEVEEEHGQMEEEAGRDKQDMKQIIRYSHLETLTQEVVDVFIRKVTVYKNKRVEIEWSFSE